MPSPAGGAVSDAEIGWDVSGAAALEENTAMMVTDRFDLSPQMFYRSFTYTVGAFCPVEAGCCRGAQL
jgi:hypothetical protein